MSPSPLSLPGAEETLWQHHTGPVPTPAGEDLQELADQFIRLKRYLGHRYHANGRYVLEFVGFQRCQGVRCAAHLSVKAIWAWAVARTHAPPIVWLREVSAVSVFLDHLQAIGAIASNPCGLMRKRAASIYRPYIFSGEELSRILALADASGPDGDRGLAYFLIYACGLRVSEATRLQIRDFDVEQGTLFIRKSKFGKDRLLPLHPRVADRLNRYRAEQRAGAAPQDPFFVNRNAAGRPYRARLLAFRFKADLSRLGFSPPALPADGLPRGSPRIHALRHTFAVNRLLRWYREGADVQAKLPLLSTYLGHSQIEHTQVYLRITGLLLREAHQRFAGHWEKQLPLSP